MNHQLLRLIGIGLLAIVATCSRAQAYDCRGRISAGTSVTGLTDYNPYSPIEILDAFRLTIANVGSDKCRYAVLFRSRSAQPKLGNTLSFAAVTATGANLLTTASASSAPTLFLDAPLSPDATGTIEYQIQIPRGQFAAPGLYDETVDLELYAVGYGDRIYGRPLHNVPLMISYKVRAVLAVNLRGGGFAATMSFGSLEPGEQRGVSIDVRGNSQYHLRVTSQNGGKLLLTPGFPGPEWAIPYTFAINGNAIGVPATLPSQSATRPESDAAYDLLVTVGEVGAKRAGNYQDLITVEVIGALY
jgi:hypothetical protein